MATPPHNFSSVIHLDSNFRQADVPQGPHWTMRAIAVGLFAVAVAIQTFNWIVKKYGIDSQDETLPASPNADKVSRQSCLYLLILGLKGLRWHWHTVLFSFSRR